MLYGVTIALTHDCDCNVMCLCCTLCKYHAFSIYFSLSVPYAIPFFMRGMGNANGPTGIDEAKWEPEGKRKGNQWSTLLALNSDIKTSKEEKNILNKMESGQESAAASVWCELENKRKWKSLLNMRRPYAACARRIESTRTNKKQQKALLRTQTNIKFQIKDAQSLWDFGK